MQWRDEMLDLKKILIVDQDLERGAKISQILENMGCEDIVVSGDVRESLNILRHENVPLILFSWDSGVPVGKVFVQKAKITRLHVPCLAYSENISETDFKLANEIGMQDLIKVPFGEIELKERIESLLDYESNIHPLIKKIRKIEIQLHVNKPDKALKLIDYRITGSKDFIPECRTICAKVWFEARNFAKAEEYAKQALDYDPDYVEALHVLAKIYSSTKRHKDAIDLLKKMVANTPENIASLLSLANAHNLNNELKEADAVYDRILEMDEDNEGAATGKGVIAYKNGEFESAKKILRKCDQGIEAARFFNAIAIDKVNSDEIDSAIKVYNDALDLLENSEKKYLVGYNLALAYQKKEEFNRAFEIAAKIYIDYPDFEKAYATVVRSAKNMKLAGIQYDSMLAKQVRVMRIDYLEKMEAQDATARRH